MEKKKNSKKILIIIAVVALMLVISLGIFLINKKTKTELAEIQVQNIVMQKVNNNDIYINDVGKVKTIKDVEYIETIDDIEYWKMNIEYELSSLSAPIGKNYAGTSLNGTFCFAYNTQNQKSYEYMFEINEYETLKGWSKANKDNLNNWK